MKKRIFIIAGLLLSVLAGVLVIRGISHRRRLSATVVEEKTAMLQSEVDTAAQTHADKKIRDAQIIVNRAPSKPDGYNMLGAAYMLKARETGDFGYNARAEAALKRSFEVSPDNYDAIKLQANLLLTYHRFSEALEMARRAQRSRPQDFEIYGALTDALVELGDYKEAVEAAQTMVNLRPYTASYARVSYLRALHGDRAGAIAAMHAAVQASSVQDPEGAAWCLVHFGDELINANRLQEAEAQYDRALEIFPDYHIALAGKARARVAAGDLNSAIEFYQRAENRVPLPDTAIALGDIYTKLGRTDEARKQYELVDFVERNGALGGTYSRQLALFWADHDVRLDDALAAAEREREMRNDVYTCDILAWCLYKKGRYDEAKTAIAEAMRLGTRDPRILYHAGMIENKIGDRQNALKNLKMSLQINPTFDLLQAAAAREAISPKA